MKVKIINKKYHKRIIIDYENQTIQSVETMPELVELLNKYSGCEIVITNIHRYSSSLPTQQPRWLGNIIDEGTAYRIENIMGVEQPATEGGQALIVKYRLTKSNNQLGGFVAFSSAHFAQNAETHQITLK